MQEIWIFNHYAVPPSLNSQHRHNQFAKHLNMKGWKVIVFFSSQVHNSEFNFIQDGNFYQKKDIDGIRYIAIKTRSYKDSGKQRVLNMIDFYKGLLKYSKLNKKTETPNIIYASSVHPLTLLAGLKISKKRGIDCVCEIRDLWPLTLTKIGRLKSKSIMSKILYIMEKHIYKKADKLIFTMSGGKQYILDQGWSKQVDLNKIHHINNGVNIKEFQINKNKNHYKHENFKKETFKVTYTGSIGQANMVHTIIEAAKIIDEEVDANISFEIFGDGLEKEKIENYVIDNKIKNVNFYGKVSPQYIPSILSESKINIIVGKNSDLYKYGFSQNKFFTYLASGKPMISNRKVHNLLEQNKSGIIVEPENPRAIAEGILKIHNMSENEYQTYCKNAFKLAQEYDYENLTEKLINVFYN